MRTVAKEGWVAMCERMRWCGVIVRERIVGRWWVDIREWVGGIGWMYGTMRVTQLAVVVVAVNIDLAIHQFGIDTIKTD